MQLIRQMNLEERRGLQNILVTGSHGLIGKAVTRLLSLNGYAVRTFDCRLPRTCPNYGDVADGNLVHLAAQDVDAIIHLAAISRVQWGDLNPDLCWQTNVVGTENVVRAAAKSKRKPVLIVASSREVYGEPIALPVDEDTPAAPVNLYGRTKTICEQATLAGREAGINTAIVRFSNVYGSTADHRDRVVPAFAWHETAQGHRDVAEAELQLLHRGQETNTFAEAERAVRRSLAIGPIDPHSWARLAHIAWRRDRDAAAATKALRASVQVGAYEPTLTAWRVRLTLELWHVLAADDRVVFAAQIRQLAQDEPGTLAKLTVDPRAAQISEAALRMADRGETERLRQLP